MSDPAQMQDTAPAAEEVGDGGASIDADTDEQALEGPDVEVSVSGNQVDDGSGQAWGKSGKKQAEGDFPIMS